MKSLLPIETGSTKGKAVVPFEFEVLLDSILAKLNKSLAEGDEIRQLAVHESGTLVLQVCHPTPSCKSPLTDVKWA